MSIKQVTIALFLLFFVQQISAQVRGRITLLPDNKTYQVSIIPDSDFSQRLSVTNSASVTIVVPVGGLEITNFTGITGQWEVASAVHSPAENPDASYYSFALISPLENIIYTSGQEIILFTFENAVNCLDELNIIENENDPFWPPNSLSANVGNLFSILGAGPVNAYTGNDRGTAPCPEPLDVNASITVNNLNCPDDLTSIEITLSGGEPPFLIEWINETTGEQDSLIFNELNQTIILDNRTIGDYSIMITDAKNQQITLNESVVGPQPITFNLNPAHVNCEESMDGAITLNNALGGTGNYQYNWSNGSTSTTINNLDTGRYVVTVTDENGCTAVQSAFVKMDGWMMIDTLPTHITCFGWNDGSIELNASGKNPPFTYDWEGNGLSGTSDNLTNLVSGSYNITVTDATGICNQTVSVQINEPPALQVSAAIDSASLCELTTENMVTITEVNNNQGSIRYSLDGINFDRSNAFVVQAGEEYTITVEDEAGCTTDLNIDVPPPSGLELSLPEDLVLQLGDDLTIEPDLVATSNVTLQWSPSEGLSCDTCLNPMVTSTRSSPYTLTVIDENGCELEATVLVYLSKVRRIFAPSAFTPNNDGVNDRFTLFTGPDVAEVHSLQIFDRWGERVYKSPDNYEPNDEYRFGWDGTINGQSAHIDVYVFMAEVTFIDGQTEILSGEVSLMK